MLQLLIGIKLSIKLLQFFPCQVILNGSTGKQIFLGHGTCNSFRILRTYAIVKLALIILDGRHHIVHLLQFYYTHNSLLLLLEPERVITFCLVIEEDLF